MWILTCDGKTAVNSNQTANIKVRAVDVYQEKFDIVFCTADSNVYADVPKFAEELFDKAKAQPDGKALAYAVFVKLVRELSDEKKSVISMKKIVSEIAAFWEGEK